MAEPNERPYPGSELDIFARAVNWKSYLKEQISSYLFGDILEVGAGIGATTSVLHDGTARRWVCLEPDPELARRLMLRLRSSPHNKTTQVVIGSLRAFAHSPCFDCLLYIDVLEHIDDDRAEIQAAARLVRPSGYMVILSPAHQWLFSEFDRRIGHRRRYNRAVLRSLMPLGWSEEKLSYMDSIGILLSLGNVFCLRRSTPTASQIKVWDRVCVPISRLFDQQLRGKLGKSLLAVWRNAPENDREA